MLHLVDDMRLYSPGRYVFYSTLLVTVAPPQLKSQQRYLELCIVFSLADFILPILAIPNTMTHICSA